MLVFGVRYVIRLVQYMLDMLYVNYSYVTSVIYMLAKLSMLDTLAILARLATYDTDYVSYVR